MTSGSGGLVGSSCVMYSDGAGPLFHFVGRMAEALGHAVREASPGESPEGAGIVVGFGAACRLAASVTGAGVWLSPDFSDAATIEGLFAATGPGLVVGSIEDPGWDRAMAARLRQFEVLQLPRVDRQFEVADDPVATLQVYQRILERVGAVLRRVP